ncbi:hypothetical protein F511_45369 [Dorcoceras hygrometricum]|uniref:Uncharacterized protein n=1 Tax=Dorcoceras hygrometricum TaxID=472368 RepID=A0A2Z6ZW26_9LAMI|nr:hypothetical protein F511_45369 [Dorcoceras hygrometricum]
MGPISNIGPKTSWTAWDRPEQNLEAKFSRHNNAGDSSDGGRTAAVAAIMHVSCGILPQIGSRQARPFSAMHGSKMAHHLRNVCARLAATGLPLSLPRRATKRGQRAGCRRPRRRPAAFKQFFFDLNLKFEIRYNKAAIVLIRSEPWL